MGRKNKQAALDIWMNGSKVGTWISGREQKFAYDPNWLKSPEARPLSLSLPIIGGKSEYSGAVVESLFDNLLPDSADIRRRIQLRFGLATDKPFEMLTEIGRDCVGAIQLLPQHTKPEKLNEIQAKKVTDTEISGILAKLNSNSAFKDYQDDFRISLAGAQEKTALLFYKNNWYIPEGATPTTHILKRPLGIIGHSDIDMSTSVENEWICMRILHHFGLPAAKCSIETFGDEKVLVSERFDRKFSSDNSWIIRLPQEDFCQATGTSAGLKYESDGGPGIREIMTILQGSNNADSDRRDFFTAQIIFWLLGAIDGHAKNFSIFILPGGRFRLTPLYDVLSVYPVMGNSAEKIHPKRVRMAMAVKASSGKLYHWNKITRDHWFSTAKACGFPATEVKLIIEQVTAELQSVIQNVKTELSPEFPANISNPIFEQMEKAALKLLS